MKKSIQGIIILMLLVTGSAQAQDQEGGYNDRAKKYVKQYAAFAIADQKISGVPAAITLGQGILETEAGISELVTEANNHFGIKCKNGWSGPTFLHTDDAKDECFKKYKSAEESYNDHSAHLHRNPRYSPLFTYSVTDYARWAHGLKKCGYATNPRYAQQLIKIIEDFRLQEYTYAALDSSNEYIPVQGVLVETITTSAPKVETTIVKEALQPAQATTVITTTTTTTKTIKVEPQAVAAGENMPQQPQATMNTPGRAPQQPQVAAMPAAPQDVKPIKETSKTGMVAVSPTATANESPAAEATVDTVAEAASPYLAEEPLDDTTDRIQTIHGLKAIRGHKDQPLLSYAVKYKVRYAQLLEMNDLPDEPLQFDTWIYLEKKNPTGPRDKHIVKAGESLLQIAQEEGMQLKRLAALNLLNPYERPAPGQTLNLQTQAAAKPVVLDYSAPKELPKDELEGKRVAAYTEPKKDVNYGMSFGAPEEEPVAVGASKQQDTSRKEIVKQPFMKEDPPQRQMSQPVPEPEYKKGDKRYQVKKGETAFSIAKKHNITVSQLLEWNDLDPQDLKAGQTLIIKQ
ncbi:hypothetical protein GCM10023093_16680 [Nemorincola caseinilytica]|uniref:Peptidoglycan hydrolase n=1 Tax=Nemorincola caseinilytica TaxID=2054315 RepID=A0ABP8NFU9_9BACT